LSTHLRCQALLADARAMAAKGEHPAGPMLKKFNEAGQAARADLDKMVQATLGNAVSAAPGHAPLSAFVLARASMPTQGTKGFLI